MKNKFILTVSIVLALVALCFSCSLKAENENTGTDINVITTGPNLNLIIKSVTEKPNSIILTWAEPDDASGMTVSCTNSTPPITQNIDKGVCTTEINGLTGNTVYAIQVTVKYSDGHYTDPAVLVVSTTSGASLDYHVIYTANDLNAVRGGVAGYDGWGLDDNYILMNDIDLTSYGAGEGWTPLGNDSVKFSGIFNGNWHVIRNLNINRSADFQGLFGYTNSGSLIKNLSIYDINVTGSHFISGLVGWNAGSINSCNVYGNISGNFPIGGLTSYNSGELYNCHTNVNATGSSTIGGLAGTNTGNISKCASSGTTNSSYNNAGGLVSDNYGTITQSYSTGAVTSPMYAGGLVTWNYQGGSISDCYSTGNVTTSSNMAGGLVGENCATINNCYAAGTVSGSGNIGGLVGLNIYGTISGSYAKGTVNSGYYFTGGLAGSNEGGTIFNCCATGLVTSTYDYTGGLVGYDGWMDGNPSGGSITESYAKGAVTSTGKYTGGLIGWTRGPVSNCYAIGTVSGTITTGGLIGQAYNGATVSYCYAVGAVSGTTETGGLVGYKYSSAVVSHSFYYQAPNNGNGTFSTEALMKTKSTYTNDGWNVLGSTYGIWCIQSGINGGFPFLLEFCPF